MILDPIKDIWNKKEIRIMDSVVIEKIAEMSSEDYGTREINATEDSRSHDGDAEHMMDNLGRFLKTHALKVDLWNFAKLRIQRSQDNPENLEIIFDINRGTPSDNGEGKCSKNVCYSITSRKDANISFSRFKNVLMFVCKRCCYGNFL
jgi:hypothetical protein